MEFVMGGKIIPEKGDLTGLAFNLQDLQVGGFQSK